MGAAAIPIAMGAQAIGGVQGAFGEIGAAKDQKNYYNYLAATSMTNARLARIGADVEAKGVGEQAFQQVGQLHEQGRDIAGSQKVALASGGAGVGSKTAEQITSDTADKVNLDEQALRYNADLRMKNIRLAAEGVAMNEENQARGYKLAGKNAVRSARIKAFSSLLSTAGQTAMTATKL